ncbi:HTH-type transcriptional regulator MtrR [Variovorax sp. PBS-H4]|uniref:TetR/AcrR family transcriptional regulator n=1 Tax=Variovorax sp. PBS-H4 TaxID=434008 RepID=UPI0013195E7E|nr:TetR/AcrR family transcriptional regulator [Variovorax sp. PBS-H4]VTU37562.1 HTH-type transcriptional regulator MtrR [Variovorax sp. PBS-H4]
MSPTPAPPRRSFLKKSPDVRRQELIDATFRCLCRIGVSDTSVRTIAAEAGLSLGMVRHHFNSKDELLAATYRYMSDRLQTQSQEALEAADDTPMAQLLAFIYAGLQPPLLDHDYVRIRFLFWELTHTNASVREVHDEIYERFSAQLIGLVKAVAKANGSQADCALITRTITAFLKGIWAEWTLSSDGFDPRKLVDQMIPLLQHSLVGTTALRKAAR